jgi:hypothetical protein
MSPHTCLLALAGASLSAIPAYTVAAAPTTAPAAASSGTCASLARDYDQVDKSLALTYAEGIGDNSAPRETNRRIENSNDLARASIIVTLMQTHHCAMPDHAPNVIRYLSEALTCSTDRLKGTQDPPSFKTDSWQSAK